VRFNGLKVKPAEDLVRDFASGPSAPFDKLLKKANDSETVRKKLKPPSPLAPTV
jgi:hypothetical protein